MTCVAFLSHSFWLYAALTLLSVLFIKPKPTHAMCLFLLLLLVVPGAGVDIPGFGVVNYFFTLDQSRLLAIVLLLPAFWSLLQDQRALKWGGGVADRWVLLYLVLAAVLQLRATTVTDSLRGCFYLFLGCFLPYYVASRSLRCRSDFVALLSAFLLSACVLGGLAIFENLRGWNLYSAVKAALGINWPFGDYLAREGMLRASVSTGHALVFGYVMAIAVGFSLFVVKELKVGLWRYLVLALLVGGLLASLSRGPWVGALLIVVFYVLFGGNPVRRLLGYGAASCLLVFLLSVAGVGQRFINMIPFVGSVDVQNVSYRQQLIDSSLVVIDRNLWFGSVDYLSAPEMQALIQGQGIIDIVNTYIGVALDYGVVGLFLFLMIFLKCSISVYARLRFFADQESWGRRLGVTLLAVLLGVAFMIFTLSSISVVPILYWVIFGLCVSYVSLPKDEGLCSTDPVLRRF